MKKLYSPKLNGMVLESSIILDYQGDIPLTLPTPTPGITQSLILTETRLLEKSQTSHVNGADSAFSLCWLPPGSRAKFDECVMSHFR